MNRKVHRVELLIVDHDEIGADEVEAVLESTRYPNDCICPSVLSIETKEVEWNELHPLNYEDTQLEFARELFAPSVPAERSNQERGQ